MGAVTLLPIALALAVGYIAGRFHQHHRASLLAENNHWCGEEIEALKGADLDADVAAHRRERLSGEQPAVPRPTPMPLGERECNNCHKPAVFAWTDEGFPFASCNFCISLWFEDGLPEWVRRLAGTPEAARRQVGFAEDDDPAALPRVRLRPAPDDVYSFLDHPDELNAWGSVIHADDDTSTGPRSVPGPRVSD